jgi:molybdopterin converting factor small subunit
MPIVTLRGPLQKLAGDGGEHRVDGATVTELLQELERTHGALDGWILDERGVLRRHINVFVNGERVKQDAPVAAEDRIEILPAISGGSSAGAIPARPTGPPPAERRTRRPAGQQPE